MARITIPANTWVDIKADLGLLDDEFYTTSNEGNSLLQVVTTESNSSTPTFKPSTKGVQQHVDGVESWLDHSASAGNAIWVFSYGRDGEMEVQL